MGMIWIDSVDFYTTAVPFPYEANTGVTIGPAFARTGLNGFQFGGTQSAIKTLPSNFTSLCAGCAIKPTQRFTNPVSVLTFEDLGVVQISAGVDSNGKAYILDSTGAVKAVTAGTVFPINQFHYLELEVPLFSTTGTGVTNLYVDGSLVLTFNGKNTSTGNAYGNQLCLGKKIDGDSNSIYNMDDIYCLDESGPAPWNAPLGDCAVVCQMPSASGSFAQWTPSPAGANLNWQRVSEIPADGITTINKTSVTGNRDSFVTGPSFPPAGLTNVGQIIAVMVLEYGQNDTPGLGGVELSARQAGVDAFGNLIVLGVGFTYGSPTFFQKDVNGNLWIPSNLNATEFGYERIV